MKRLHHLALFAPLSLFCMEPPNDSYNQEDEEDFVIIDLSDYAGPQLALEKANRSIKQALEIMLELSGSDRSNNSKSDHKLLISQGFEILSALLQKKYAPAYAYAASLWFLIPQERITTRNNLLKVIKPVAQDVQWKDGDAMPLTLHLITTGKTFMIPESDERLFEAYLKEIRDKLEIKTLKDQIAHQLVLRTARSRFSLPEEPKRRLFDSFALLKSTVETDGKQKSIATIAQLLETRYKPAYAVAAYICITDEYIPEMCLQEKKHAVRTFDAQVKDIELPPFESILDHHEHELTALKLLKRGTAIITSVEEDRLTFAQYKVLSLSALLSQAKDQRIKRYFQNIIRQEELSELNLLTLVHQRAVEQARKDNSDLTISQQLQITTPSLQILQKWREANK